MADEPVDRRGLFREMFRQAAGAIPPVLGVNLDRPAEQPERHARGALATRMVSIDELLAKAGEFGLEDRGEALGELACTSLRLVPAAHSAPSGVEFGGRPLMGEGQEWPSWQGRPLTFLGQVDSGERLGRLLFFYDTIGRPSGCLGAHRGSARVLRAGEGPLVARDGPALPEVPVAGQLAGELVLPGASSARVESLALSEEEREAWENLRGSWRACRGQSRRSAGRLSSRSSTAFSATPTRRAGRCRWHASSPPRART